MMSAVLVVLVMLAIAWLVWWWVRSARTTTRAIIRARKRSGLTIDTWGTFIVCLGIWPVFWHWKGLRADSLKYTPTPPRNTRR